MSTLTLLDAPAPPVQTASIPVVRQARAEIVDLLREQPTSKES